MTPSEYSGLHHGLCRYLIESGPPSRGRNITKGTHILRSVFLTTIIYAHPKAHPAE
ncbi:hypothetical protein HanOQP8_Chr14g0528841 [Helianthus annuus]|nr:hypothetical protein HanOQP8_Chr14g0528841 [Helianthus annuus]